MGTSYTITYCIFKIKLLFFKNKNNIIYETYEENPFLFGIVTNRKDEIIEQLHRSAFHTGIGQDRDQIVTDKHRDREGEFYHVELSNLCLCLFLQKIKKLQKMKKFHLRLQANNVS